MRGYENLNKSKNALKLFYYEKIQTRSGLILKIFMRGYENLNKGNNNLNMFYYKNSKKQ